MDLVPRLLSGSAYGKPILITATGFAGTLIHTAVSGTYVMDFIWLTVSNIHSEDLLLTVGWGGETDPNTLLCKNFWVPGGSSEIEIATGKMLQNALAITAFANVASKLLISGKVLRYAA